MQHDVEQHVKAGWRGTLPYYAAAIVLLPLLAPLVLIQAVRDWQASVADGSCWRCGHKHTGPLLLATDANGWRRVRVCG